jgi:hypothetical protein
MMGLLAQSSSEHSMSPPLLLTVSAKQFADAPPKLVMLALCDLLQEHLELDAYTDEAQGVRTLRQFWSKQT